MPSMRLDKEVKKALMALFSDTMETEAFTDHTVTLDKCILYQALLEALTIGKIQGKLEAGVALSTLDDAASATPKQSAQILTLVDE